MGPKGLIYLVDTLHRLSIGKHDTYLGRVLTVYCYELGKFLKNVDMDVFLKGLTGSPALLSYK